MANYELRVGDTFPFPGITLSDNSGVPAIDLTNVTSVHFALKGLTAALITGVYNIGQIDATGTCNSTTTVSSVSPTTGYANGATVYSPGLISAGTTIASGAGTATLTLSQAAIGAGTGTIFVNMGLVYIPLNAGQLATGFTTADTYSGESYIHWTAGGRQTVPNQVSQNFTIIADTEESTG